jgi:hypothetical protein
LTVAVSPVIARRLARQRLLGTLHKSPAQAVASLGAVQSQDYPGAKWAVGQRVAKATDASIEAAFNRGDIVRVHALRPTWHFVAPADLRWIQSLTGLRVQRILASYDRQLGLDGKTLAKAFRLLERALRDRSFKTRADLAAALTAGGISAAGQTLARIMGHAELTALVCSGPQRGRLATYALVDEWVPPAKVLTRDEALAELTRRYFTSHGPATVKDFVWWSGLTVKDTREGLDAIGARSEQGGDLTLWHVHAPRLKVSSPGGSAHLLPNYDEYLVAYKDRMFVVPPTFKTMVAEQRVDIFAHVLIVDGRLAGTWRRVIANDIVRVSVELHAPLKAAARQSVQDAAHRLGVFHGMKVDLELVHRR